MICGVSLALEGVSFPNKNSNDSTFKISVSFSNFKNFVSTECVEFASVSNIYYEKPLYVFSETEITSNNLYQSNVKTIFWNALPTIPSSAFYYNRLLENIYIPEGVTRISSQAFYDCKRLKEIILPSTLTSIGSSAFSGVNKRCVIDMSKIKTFLQLTSDISLNTTTNIIKVPNELLDQYKSASYWSKYADCMVGV